MLLFIWEKCFRFKIFPSHPYNELLTPLMIAAIVAAILFSMPLGQWFGKLVDSGKDNNRKGNLLFSGKAILCLIGLFFCIVKLATGDFNPFIYFRF